MQDVPYENIQPLSHFQQMVELDRREPAYSLKQQAYNSMQIIYDGWCSNAKAAVLIDLILKYKPETVVEIGVWAGKSLIPMAHAVKANGKGTVYGIDPWDPNVSAANQKNEVNRVWWGTRDHDLVLRTLCQRVYDFGLEPLVVLIKSTSKEATPIFEIDLLHVDGDHSRKTSKEDVEKWVPLMRRGGWIIFDDMTWFEDNEYQTAEAVDYLNEHCIKIAEFSDTSVWGIWRKP